MPSLPQPLQLLLMMFAGWVDRYQLDLIDYSSFNTLRPSSCAFRASRRRSVSVKRMRCPPKRSLSRRFSSWNPLDWPSICHQKGECRPL